MNLAVLLEDKAFQDLELVGLVLLQLDEAFKNLDFSTNEDRTKIICSSEKHGNWLDKLSQKETEDIAWLIAETCQVAFLKYRREKIFSIILTSLLILTPFIILAVYLLLKK